MKELMIMKSRINLPMLRQRHQRCRKFQCLHSTELIPLYSENESFKTLDSSEILKDSVTYSLSDGTDNSFKQK